MSHQPLARAVTSLPELQESFQPVTASSYRSALQCLYRAYTSHQSLALLISEGKCGARYLIDHFFAGIDKDATSVRISEPCTDEQSAMRAIIRGIGFDPTDLSLSDMENVLSLFLSFQANHGLRTVLCIEQTQECGLWVLDIVRRLLDVDAASHRGLLLLLSGLPGTDELLKESLRDALASDAGQRTLVGPFTLPETREYLRWRVESVGSAEIADVFEFDAISYIYELTKGVTDEVGDLYASCLHLAAQENALPISVELVKRARLQFDTAPTPDPEQLIDQIDSSVEKKARPNGGRLVIRVGDDEVHEYFLDRGHVLIGRGKLCDVRLPSPSVSRHHALVISSPVGAILVDLESTNGTYVDGKQIKEHPLQSSGVITMGDCSVDFIGDEDEQDWVLDVHGAKRAEPYAAEFVTQQLETWHRDFNRTESKTPASTAIKGNINRKGEKIYHLPGTSKYNATKIDESKGERWFATEDEAIAAGWRAPRIS